MDNIPKFLTIAEASDWSQKSWSQNGSQQVAVVRNPSYIYAPLEFYPLAPKPTRPLESIHGIVKDMDGTTTTTEVLCLHSLEWMVRAISDTQSKTQWSGLSHQSDYPHVIGNSTTKHVEYLLTTYADRFDATNCLQAWILAAAWTLVHGRDEGRRKETQANFSALGLQGLAEDARFIKWINSQQVFGNESQSLAKQLATEYLESFKAVELRDRVRAAIDIYYMRYHLILAAIAEGRAEQFAEELSLDSGTGMIEPLPAVGIFLAAVSGLLGKELSVFYDELRHRLSASCPDAVPDESVTAGRARIAALGAYLAAHPVPLAVVTSSISYEANIVLAEVFKSLRADVADWAVSDQIKESLEKLFSTPQSCYSAIITASDSSEIRLKPHRDLYSLALHTMGIARENFDKVIGFEDSESGVIAIRAAGVGLSVAVPFADTGGHDLSAAAAILPGQMPQALLAKRLFLADSTLTSYST